MFKNIDDGKIKSFEQFRKEWFNQGWLIFLTATSSWNRAFFWCENSYQQFLQKGKQNQLFRCNASNMCWSWDYVNWTITDMGIEKRSSSTCP